MNPHVLRTLDPKSSASANSATPAYVIPCVGYVSALPTTTASTSVIESVPLTPLRPKTDLKYLTASIMIGTTQVRLLAAR